MKCPVCGKTAVKYVYNNKLIIECKARNPCGYYNKRPL